uniref:Astacin domain-containing protein n=1 Tax=Globodera pallida TaxID=36090 RepID=A0A183C3I3_GLOPA
MRLLLFLVGLFVVGVYKLADYRNRQKAEESRKLMLLVERITDIIYDSGSSGVAEPHVRDMIMPPTKRSGADAKRWQEAALFINNEDSRIRTEIRLIDGTECNVWIWVGAGKQHWQGTGN